MALDLRDTDAGASLRVRVQPRASREGIGGERLGALLVRVTAPPVEGRANEAVERLLGDALGLPRSAVRVMRGGTGRDKVVSVHGMDAATIRERLGG